MTRILARAALLPGGWARDVAVTLEEGRIAAVETGVSEAAGAPRALIPAPGNLHSHAFQRAMAGRVERRAKGRDDFWSWRTLMYRFLDLLTPEQVEAIAALAQVEALESGFAAIGEFHYLHNQPGGAAYADPAEMARRIVAASETTGIGLTLLPCLYMQGGADGRALEGGQTRFRADPDHAARILEGARAAMSAPDAVIGLAPHSLRAVPEKALAEAPQLVDGPLHIHAAEQVKEVEEIEAALGARPVRWLLDHADISPRWCLIHCTQMTAQETQALARSGAVAGLCPITEANLGDGIFDGARYLGAGGRFGVGSDSNVRISLAGELRQLEYSQRLRDRARCVLSAEGSVGTALLAGAARGAAQALGRGAGRIAVGEWADLTALDADDLVYCGLPPEQLADAFIFAGGPVRDVWSAGRHVVRDGRHAARVHVDAAARRALKGLSDAI